MQKLIDFDKTYAIALSGGGAKGGYEVGVWRALQEEGLKYSAVSGTSVGALNGALMAMRDLDTAEELWRNIRYSDVMDVDDENMGKLFDKKVRGIDIGGIVKKAYVTFRDGGFDITPLRNLLHKYIDVDKIKKSAVEFFLVTYSITERKELDLTVKALPEDEICDMLLASAYFPAFKNEPMTGGRRFMDGGISDTLPITPLADHGYKDIIAVRLRDGLGKEKRVRYQSDLNIHYIEPRRKLGNTLNFSSEQARYNLELGYYDAKRYIYGLAGDHYYLERTLDEYDAYRELVVIVRQCAESAGKELSLRTVHELSLPKLAHELEAKGDYYDVFLHWLENEAKCFGLPEFRILKDVELLAEVKKAAAGGEYSKTLLKAACKV